MKKSILLLFFFCFVTNINAQNVTFITITGSCFPELDGWYDYDGNVNGKASYYKDGLSFGDLYIYWDNTQWVLDVSGAFAMTNSTNSPYPPIGFGTSWTPNTSVGCNTAGFWGGSTSFIDIRNSCFPELDGFYIYNGDTNGKASYYKDGLSFGDLYIYWDNTQWVLDVSGAFAMTNSTNSPEPPSCDSSWTPNTSVGCNTVGDFTGPDCYVILDNSCFTELDGFYIYNGDTNGKASYYKDGLSFGDLYIYWDNTNTQWVLDVSGAFAMTNSTDSPSPEIGTWTPNTSVGCNTAGDFLGPNSQLVLPVELLSFTGEVWENQINLDWQTASEINNENFEVEESQDGRSFQKIGIVDGKGTTNEQQDYLFEVENPRIGVSYFRLKQIDFDGQFEYSEVISIDFKGNKGELGQFYPNPSKSGLVNLDYFAQNDDEVEVLVFDMTGKLVVNQTQSILKGNNNMSFDFSELNTGIYIVKIGDGGNSTHRKLIIER